MRIQNLQPVQSLGTSVCCSKFVASAVIVVIGTYCFLATPATARPSEKRKELRREEPREWQADVEHRKRTFPLDHIPPDARARALQQTQQAEASSPPPNFGVSAKWYSIGPAAIGNSPYANGQQAAGRVAAVAVDPSNASHWLIGAARGGIWETKDAGTTWHPRTDDQPSLAMGVITFVPSNPLLVYAGTGEPNFRGDDYAGAGLLVSSDGGTHWQMRNTLFAQTSLSAIRIDPTNSSHLTVATVRGGAGITDPASGMNTIPNEPSRGVFVASDGGANFTGVLTGEATDLQVNEGNFNRQYAALVLLC